MRFPLTVVDTVIRISPSPSLPSSSATQNLMPEFHYYVSIVIIIYCFLRPKILKPTSTCQNISLLDSCNTNSSPFHHSPNTIFSSPQKLIICLLLFIFFLFHYILKFLKITFFIRNY